MYLKGIQYSEMESILQFIYLGEATIFEERMDELLTVAKSLEIKELYHAATETNVELEDEPSDPSTSNENLEIQDDFVKQPPKENYKVNCEPSKKQFARKNGLCDDNSGHQGVKYSCDQCDYQGSTQWNLTAHIQSKHEGVKYVCDKCDYQATLQGNLNKHIQSQHEGVKYSCDQCDYQASSQSNLAAHIKSKHEGVKYDCNQCDFKSARQGNLRKHIRNKHEAVFFGSSTEYTN